MKTKKLWKELGLAITLAEEQGKAINELRETNKNELPNLC